MMHLTDKEVRLRPSMQLDAIKQRPMEIEVILGKPLRIAEKLDRKMPVLTVLYELLKAKQWGFRGS
jgi:ketopantoate reductase